MIAFGIDEYINTGIYKLLRAWVDPDLEGGVGGGVRGTFLSSRVTDITLTCFLLIALL